MGNKWTTLRAKMTPERREANRLAAQQMIAAMPFEELRDGTQYHADASGFSSADYASIGFQDGEAHRYVCEYAYGHLFRRWAANWKFGQSFQKEQYESNNLQRSPQARRT